MECSKTYNNINDIPEDSFLTGEVYSLGQYLVYNVPGHEEYGKTGFVDSIQYAPLDDHYYQRVKVSTGEFTYIESASKFWTPCS